MGIEKFKQSDKFLRCEEPFKLFFLWLVICVIGYNANAQCGIFPGLNVVSGQSGTIYTDDITDSVNYTVTTTGGASFANLGFATNCGITFPGINAPWSGNTTVSTATFTFSAPITSVDVILGYVGLLGLLTPESFTFTTNGSVPSLIINTGSCIGWLVLGNHITSPLVVDPLNAIVTVTSSVPFTTLTIESATNNTSGGTSYGLCNRSLIRDTIQPCPLISLSYTVAVAKPPLIKGAMSVFASGGDSPYLYSLDSLTFQISNTFTSLALGAYQVYVTDDNGCTAQGAFTIKEANCNCRNH